MEERVADMLNDKEDIVEIKAIKNISFGYQSIKNILYSFIKIVFKTHIISK